MSSLLKDIYSPLFFDRFSDVLSVSLPSFDKQVFLNKIFDKDFQNKELKARMKHTSKVLHDFFPEDYGQTVELIQKLIEELRSRRIGEDSLVSMFLPDYIETYGMDDFEHSVKALEFITQFVSCEFSVRPFILRYGDRMLDQMTAWSLHENHKVRRLATEGSRPRLPWAMALPELKKNPAKILPLLENLKNDPSESVRRSVANNLNDIAKDNPEIVIEIAKRWKGNNKETDAIIKHGCRTLLKLGHVEILKHYGLDAGNIAISDFEIPVEKVPIGGALHFSFTVLNLAAELQTVRLEYAVYYLRQNGTLSKKVFKISERIYQPNEKAKVSRKQSFKLITTRKFYDGLHQLSVIVNGEEKQILPFELTALADLPLVAI